MKGSTECYTGKEKKNRRTSTGSPSSGRRGKKEMRTSWWHARGHLKNNKVIIAIKKEGVRERVGLE